MSSECPDFENIYLGVEQAMKIQFESLNVLVDQGAFMYLKAYLEGIQTRYRT